MNRGSRSLSNLGDRVTMPLWRSGRAGYSAKSTSLNTTPPPLLTRVGFDVGCQAGHHGLWTARARRSAWTGCRMRTTTSLRMASMVEGPSCQEYRLVQ